ncbi:MAG: hypothetical protein CL561_05195 [Alphaproteobacteria bacterium]|nr:hypothetical protein [Alphaproteobacteria bacterium]|tara:strand:- start:1361 stop:1975 length:615 start_codon:yes stop_codon:yes gene_type:complete
MNTDNNAKTESELQGPFSQMGQPGALDALRHEHHDVIVQKARESLNKVPTGQALLKLLERYKFPINVLKGKEITYISPDEKSLTIFAPPEYKNLESILAMALGLGLRELEQALMGITRPSEEMDDITYCQRVLTKSVDITKYMCIIANEFHEKLNDKKPLDKVIELGHGDVYTAYVNKVSYEEFVDIFVENDIEAYEKSTGNSE